MDVVNLKQKLALVTRHWSPGIIAQVNDYHVKIAKVQGEFTQHAHQDTDELFLVLKGKLTLVLPAQKVDLAEGELYVVPAGVPHQPVAEEECAILMIEPAGTVNTGDTTNELTVEAEWL